MALGNSGTDTYTLRYPKGLITPVDFANFVLFPGFEQRWKNLGLTGIDLEVLRVAIMVDPKRAPVVRGTGGLRKIRFAPPRWNVGKSGALRIGYAYSEQRSVVLLVTAFAKHEKATLSPGECKAIKCLLKEAWARV